MSDLLLNSTSAEYLLSLVNHLLTFSNTEIDKNLAFKVVLCLIQEIKYNEDKVDNLTKAVCTYGMCPTDCVVISRATAIFINTVCLELPHVMYVKLWRWPKITAKELTYIRTCSFGFGRSHEQICVNPYHYVKKSLPKEAGKNKTSAKNQNYAEQSSSASHPVASASAGAIPKTKTPQRRAIVKKSNVGAIPHHYNAQPEYRELSSEGLESELLRDSAVLAVVSVGGDLDEHGRSNTPSQINKQVKISFRQDNFEPNRLLDLSSLYGDNSSMIRSFIDTLGSSPTSVEIFDFNRNRSMSNFGGQQQVPSGSHQLPIHQLFSSNYGFRNSLYPSPSVNQHPPTADLERRMLEFTFNEPPLKKDDKSKKK